MGRKGKKRKTENADDSADLDKSSAKEEVEDTDYIKIVENEDSEFMEFEKEEVEDTDYIKIVENEDSEFMEFEKEEDGTLLLSTIQSQFPHAIGIKYKGPSGAWRAIRVANNVLESPKGGWGHHIYYLTVAETKKRKMIDSTKNETGSKVNKITMIKNDRESGKSRGFGFIRFKEEESAKRALQAEHHIMGRNVKVNQTDKRMRLFVGNLPSGTTTQDMEEYFSNYGPLTDTYLPRPFRRFGFVTFATAEDATTCTRGTHVLRGSRLNVLQRTTDNHRQESRNMSPDRTKYNSTAVQPSAYTVKNDQKSHSCDADLKALMLQFLISQT